MDIVVVPGMGRMFWIQQDVHTARMSVVRASMDGQNDQSVYSADTRHDAARLLHHLTFDADDNVLYWLNDYNLFKYNISSGIESLLMTLGIKKRGVIVIQHFGYRKLKF